MFTGAGATSLVRAGPMPCCSFLAELAIRSARGKRMRRRPRTPIWAKTDERTSVTGGRPALTGTAGAIAALIRRCRKLKGPV